MTPVYSNNRNVCSLQLSSDAAEVIYEDPLEDPLDGGDHTVAAFSIPPPSSLTPDMTPQRGEEHTLEEYILVEEDSTSTFCTSAGPSPLISAHPVDVTSAAATQTLVTMSKRPPPMKKQKCKGSEEVAWETIVQTLKCVQELVKVQEKKQPNGNEFATQTVRGFLRHIPDSHHTLKSEYTKKILKVTAEFYDKYHAELTNGQQ